MDLGVWLRGLGLERYEADFRDNEIDWAVLPKLTSDDLRDIGVTAVGHRRDQCQTGADRPLGVVFMCPGISEIGQHAVAHVFRDESIEPCNDLGDGTMVGANDVAQILGVETRGQGCRADEIAKHNGQLPALRFGRSRAAAGRGGWNWIWGCVGSAELGNGFEQLPAVPYRCHADVRQIIGRQLRQHRPIDFVVAEGGLVSLETLAAQPRRYVHRAPLFNPSLSSPAAG